jgi:hypothetical protein
VFPVWGATVWLEIGNEEITVPRLVSLEEWKGDAPLTGGFARERRAGMMTGSSGRHDILYLESQSMTPDVLTFVRRIVFSCLTAVLLQQNVSAQERGIALWLTNPDRSSLLQLQDSSCHLLPELANFRASRSIPRGSSNRWWASGSHSPVEVRSF